MNIVSIILLYLFFCGSLMFASNTSCKPLPYKKMVSVAFILALMSRSEALVNSQLRGQTRVIIPLYPSTSDAGYYGQRCLCNPREGFYHDEMIGFSFMCQNSDNDACKNCIICTSDSPDFQTPLTLYCQASGAPNLNAPNNLNCQRK